MLWFDGRLRSGTIARFDLSDRGLLLGDGVFDTALALNGRVAHEDAHLRRLTRAGDALGFAIDRGEAETALRTLARTGPLLAIRLTATRGSAPRGLAPPDVAKPILWASATSMTKAAMGAALTLWPTHIRRNERSPTSRLKTLGYLDAVLAAKEAQRHGYDDSLFLNTQDHVACAGFANVFVVIGDTLLTPPLADGVLDGIMRQRVIALAPRLGLSSDETSFTVDTIQKADAVFVTNSLRLLCPVTKVGDSSFPSIGHPIVETLASALTTDIVEACGLHDGDLLKPQHGPGAAGKA